MAQTPVIEIDYGDLLNKARAAYTQYMMGGFVSVFVDQNGERVEYGATNINKLAGWIAFLEIKTGVSKPVGPGMGYMAL